MPQRWCEVCSKPFTHRQSLFKHRKRYHGSGMNMTRRDSTRGQSVPNRRLLFNIQRFKDSHTLREEADEADSEKSDDSVPEDETSSMTDDDPSTGIITDKYTWKDRGIMRNRSTLLPRDIRAILIGKNGVGKTTLLTHLLLEPNMLDYDTLMVCGKSLHQPEYEVMRSGFDKNLSKWQVSKIFEHQEKIINQFYLKLKVVIKKCILIM